MSNKKKFYLYDYPIHRFLKNESKLNVPEFFAKLRDCFRHLIWYYDSILTDKKCFGVLFTRPETEVEIYVLVDGDRYKISRSWSKPLGTVIARRHDVSGDLFFIPNDFHGDKNQKRQN